LRVRILTSEGGVMSSPEEPYLVAVRQLHERMSDLLVLTMTLIDHPTLGKRLRRPISLQLTQLQATVRDTLKVIEG
jgi:hypothetical protein